MEENYRQWHQNKEQQLAADIQAAEEKADAQAEARKKRLVSAGCVFGVAEHCTFAPQGSSAPPQSCDVLASYWHLLGSDDACLFHATKHDTVPDRMMMNCGCNPAGVKSSRQLSIVSTSSNWQAKQQRHKQHVQQMQHSGRPGVSAWCSSSRRSSRKLLMQGRGLCR